VGAKAVSDTFCHPNAAVPPGKEHSAKPFGPPKMLWENCLGEENLFSPPAPLLPATAWQWVESLELLAK